MTYSATWLPDAIRSMGVEVVEVDGWQDRGHGDVDPAVFVSHHTADGPNGATNSLGIVINGASYTASGPLANILQSREPGEGNDKAYIVAAGTSYNAGTGGWRGVSGNVHTIGNEIEHTGTFPLPQHRVETACRIAAGCLLAMGQPAENHCHHWEWSYPPGSKIDVCCGTGPGGKCDGDEWRVLTAQFMHGGGPLPPDPFPDLSFLTQQGDNAAMLVPWYLDAEWSGTVTPAGDCIVSRVDDKPPGHHQVDNEVVMSGLNPNVQPSWAIRNGNLVVTAQSADGKNRRRVWIPGKGWIDG